MESIPLRPLYMIVLSYDTRGPVCEFRGDVVIWKARGEEYLVNSGLDYVIICPSAINDNSGGEKSIRIIPRTKFKAGMEITRKDLATVVVTSAGYQGAKNKVFTVINEKNKYSNSWVYKINEMPEELNLP